MEDYIKDLEEFKSKKLTLSTVESFTGGMFSKLITDVSGVSSFFKGGIVAYSNEIKEKLGVKHQTLETYSAVSKECCKEMATCGIEYFDTDVCVSFTGNAGPLPSEGKEVGLIYIGIGYRRENKVEVKVHELFLPTLSRDEIRTYATSFAFKELAKIYNEGE